MRILVSNDDGIDAPGLAALVRAFADAGHELTVCAPDGQRSAASHSITLHRPLPVRGRTFPGAARAFAVGGTPADCVRLGLKALSADAEFVLSGINHGYNIGTDALYSGTVAAAMEGALGGLPAMAVSLGKESDDYGLAAAEALRVFGLLQKRPLPPLAMMNLNVTDRQKPAGLRACPLRPLRYSDSYRMTEERDGAAWYACEGWLDERQEPGDDDFSWVFRGYSAITVLSYNLAEEDETLRYRELI